MVQIIGYGIAILGLFLAILGLILLIVSNIMYFARSKDNRLLQFWLKKDILTPREYRLNRGGLGLWVLGILLIMIFTCTVVSLGSG